MIGWKFEFGTLSDLSATIFSVFLLLLVLLFDAALNPQSSSNAPLSVERAPLGASAMADLLYQRRLSALGTRIDVLPKGLRVLASSARSGIQQDVDGIDMSVRDLGQLISVGRLPEPFSVYVFSNDLYDDVARTLQNNGYQWREISVPYALKLDEQGAWNKEFRALLNRQLTKDAFVKDLASILGGGTQRSGGDFFRDGGVNAAKYISISERLTQAMVQLWTRIPIVAILNLIICLCGLGAVIWVELRNRRIRREMK